MANVILVRHGQTDWDRQKRLKGALDIPLNSDGQKEAQKMALELSGFRIRDVYAGPESCSISTANEIAAPRKLKVKKVDELVELDHGVWQGLLLRDIKKRYKKQYNIWKAAPISSRPPKGETIKDACDRVVSAVHKIIDKTEGEDVCLVMGDVALSILKCYALNLDLNDIWKFVPKKACWEAVELKK